MRTEIPGARRGSASGTRRERLIRHRARVRVSPVPAARAAAAGRSPCAHSRTGRPPASAVIARTSIAPSPCLRWAGWTTSSPLRASAGSAGRVQMGEPGQVAAPPEEQVAGARITAVPDVQHGLLRQRPHAVLRRRGGGEPQHGLRLGRADPAAHGDGSRARRPRRRGLPARPQRSARAGLDLLGFIWPWRGKRAAVPAAQLAVVPPPRHVTGAARMPAAAILRLQRDEPVAHVAHGTDQRLVLRAELGPQPPHVDVHRPGAAEVVIAPHLLQQLGAGEDPAGMLGEELQQLELLEREIQDAGAQPGAVGGLVDGEVAGADLVRRRRRLAGLPSRWPASAWPRPRPARPC